MQVLHLRAATEPAHSLTHPLAHFLTLLHAARCVQHSCHLGFFISCLHSVFSPVPPPCLTEDHATYYCNCQASW